MPLTLEDVLQAKQALEAAGDIPSANKILARLGTGSKKTVLKFMRQVPPRPVPPPVAASPAAAAQAPAVVHAPPPTLLQSAEADLQDAIRAENRARREWDAAPRAERERLEAAWMGAKGARERAATVLEARQRALTRLRAEIPSLRITARRAVGELATLEDQVRRQLLKARREAHQAGEELERMITDLVMIAGAAALPSED